MCCTCSARAWLLTDAARLPASTPLLPCLPRAEVPYRRSGRRGRRAWRRRAGRRREWCSVWRWGGPRWARWRWGWAFGWRRGKWRCWWCRAGVWWAWLQAHCTQGDHAVGRCGWQGLDLLYWQRLCCTAPKGALQTCTQCYTPAMSTGAHLVRSRAVWHEAGQGWAIHLSGLQRSASEWSC